jgi:glycerol-3-phosphate dehydrogenase
VVQTLHPLSLSDIEAEVRYAVRYEYAQTAIDVISRRTRLSFLNAQAALEALPRVVDIMAEEFKWGSAQKKKQIEQATEFLGTMGLAPGMADALQEPSSRNSLYLDKLKLMEWSFSHATAAKTPTLYTRSPFEAGEVEALRDAFFKHAHKVATNAGEQMKIKKDGLSLLLHDIPGYEDIPLSDYEYVLDEAGFRNRQELDFDEFIEVSTSWNCAR